MSLVYNVNEVLTVEDLMSGYNDKTSIKNLIEKLGYSVNSNLTNVDILLDTFSELQNISLFSSDNVTTNMLHNVEYLKLIPLKIKVNIVNNYAMLFINNNVYSIQKADYDNIISKSDSYVVSISGLDTNTLLDDTDDNCINDECFYLHTRLYRLYGLNISIIDILELGIDYSQDLVYIHTEIPLTNLNDYLNSIDNNENYIVNKKTRTDIWVSKSLFDNIFTKDMSNIKNNRIREFVWYVRDYCKGKDTTKDYILKDCFSIIKNKLTTQWSNIKDVELAEDFPELVNISDFMNIPMVKVTVSGRKGSLNINANTSSVLLNNQLEKLKNDLITT